jgi:hypothetical protein
LARNGIKKYPNHSVHRLRQGIIQIRITL